MWDSTGCRAGHRQGRSDFGQGGKYDKGEQVVAIASIVHTLALVWRAFATDADWFNISGTTGKEYLPASSQRHQ